MRTITINAILILSIGFIFACSVYKRESREDTNKKVTDNQVKYREGTFTGSSQSVYTDEPYWGKVKLSIRKNSIDGD